MEIQEALLRVLIHGMVREAQVHRDHPLQKEAFDLVFPKVPSPMGAAEEHRADRNT